jgi:hypothetical protein
MVAATVVAAADREAVGEMNAEFGAGREAKCRRLGIEPRSGWKPVPKPDRERKSVLEVLLD